MAETSTSERWWLLASVGTILSTVTGFLLWVMAYGPSPITAESASVASAVPDWTPPIVYALLAGVLLLAIIVAWAITLPPSHGAAS